MLIGATRKALDSLYVRRLKASLADAALPRNVGIMLDGNRRWAKSLGYGDPIEGYRVGGEKVQTFLRWCDAAGIEHVTLFMLSDDNLHRPESEVKPLIGIIEEVVEGLAEPQNKWEVGLIGSLDLLPDSAATRIKEAASSTVGRNGGTRVDIAVGYGGRREITDAVRSALAEHLAQGGNLEEIVENFNSDDISRHVYSRGNSDVDLIIRTSGEQRLSGFLLWQSAYAEVHFCECYWPDFREIDFLRALRSFSGRHRRYGK
ncbi:isoprenyl transferase [Nonomuraea sp. NPDC049129]|uniref:isoprenyl transferase n=1 Tax=Nonomuraea sp. NPDC049129 TaxID=3155272 RepID=UPI0033DE14AE